MHSRDKRAVSPVLGIVLIAVVTIGLATTVGVFALNLGGTVEKTPVTGMTADVEVTGPGTTPEITILHVSGDRIRSSEMEILVKSPNGTAYIDPTGGINATENIHQFTEGNQGILTGTPDRSYVPEYFSAGDRIEVELSVDAGHTEGGDATVSVLHKPTEKLVSRHEFSNDELT